MAKKPMRSASEFRGIQPWMDVLAIDTDGSIYGYEGDCFFEEGCWIPIDDFDGLQYGFIGGGGEEIAPEVARTLRFVRNGDAFVQEAPEYEQSEQENIAALPEAADEFTEDTLLNSEAMNHPLDEASP